MRSTNMLLSRKGRLYAFGIMYLSEGIPYGFATTAMVMFMRMQGLSIEQIGAFVAAVLLPWGFKWIFGPLVDIVKLNRFGGRKAWIMVCTAMMIVTLLVMAAVDFVANYKTLVWMVILNNIFCATQDVAIDSLAVSTLKDNERATANGYMFGGMYLGIAMGGGGAIFISSMWGFNAALVFVSSILFANMVFILLFVKDADAELAEKPHRQGAFSHFVGQLGQFIRDLYSGFVESGSGPKIGLIFALLPVGAMALAYAILGTLQVDYGLSEAQISKIAFASSMITAFGCLVGGYCADKFGIKRVMALAYGFTAIPTIYMAAQISTVGLTNIPPVYFYATILSHSLIFGMGYAIHAAIFMGMTKPAVAATQFTAYMALSNIAISIGNLWQGVVAERFSYSLALYLDAGIIVLALAVIPFLKNREEKSRAIDTEMELVTAES
jgi:PAT family beta-lactamase induction signal transducer AmpG